jgi:hypothetical protein
MKVSPEKGLTVKRKSGPVAAIFAKVKPAPNVSAPDPQHAQTAEQKSEDVHKILPPGWSDDDEGDVKPEDGVVVNPNDLVQLSYPKKKADRHPEEQSHGPAFYVLLF